MSPIINSMRRTSGLSQMIWFNRGAIPHLSVGVPTAGIVQLWAFYFIHKQRVTAICTL